VVIKTLVWRRVRWDGAQLPVSIGLIIRGMDELPELPVRDFIPGNIIGIEIDLVLRILTVAAIILRAFSSAPEYESRRASPVSG
jgi:hypothetical protein